MDDIDDLLDGLHHSAQEALRLLGDRGDHQQYELEQGMDGATDQLRMIVRDCENAQKGLRELRTALEWLGIK